MEVTVDPKFDLSRRRRRLFVTDRAGRKSGWRQRGQKQRRGTSLDHGAAGNLKCVGLCIGFVLVHDRSVFAKSGKAVRRKTSGLPPGIVRKVDNDGRSGASHHYPSKWLLFRRVDFHVRQEGGNMNEIAGLCTRGRFASFAPADFADTREDVGDGLLLAMMMNSGPRSRCHLEQAAPDR